MREVPESSFPPAYSYEVDNAYVAVTLHLHCQDILHLAGQRWHRSPSSKTMSGNKASRSSRSRQFYLVASRGRLQGQGRRSSRRPARSLDERFSIVPRQNINKESQPGPAKAAFARRLLTAQLLS
jgi:hypothetical protein